MVIYVVSEIAHLGKNDDNDASNNLNLRYKIKQKIDKIETSISKFLK